MKRSLTFVAALIAVPVLLVAGCGGDTDEVPAGAVAVIDGTTITRQAMDEVLTRAKKSYAAQKRDFPKAGTPEYQSLQTQVVAFLVQREEYAREAEKLDVTVTDAQIAGKLDEVKTQYFAGDQKKLEKGLADQGYTIDALREDIRSQLVTEGIYAKVTADVKVSEADLKAYYDQNKSNYSVAESREVRHILVKTKAQADKLQSQLEGGADFAALAKQSSLDPGSKNQGGKLTITRGQTVEPFDKAAFSLKTNELSVPIKTEFGYHLIEPLGAVKKGSVTPFAQVKAQIRSQLEGERKNKAVNEWVTATQKAYEDKITYAAGFEPPETSTEETTTAP